jgi:cytochrome P450
LTKRSHATHRSQPHRWVSRLTPGSDGLLFIEGERWLRQVQAVQPVFSARHLDQFPALIHWTTRTLADRWVAAGQLTDLFRAITELGCLQVLHIGYGLAPDDELARAFGRELVGYKLATMTRDGRYRLDQFGYSLARLLDLPWLLRGHLDLRRRVARLRRLVQLILAKRRVQPVSTANWIDGLDRAELPLHELTDALNHIYGAYNAADFAITATLFELSRHPEWLARVRTELDQVLGEQAYPTRDDLPALPLTRAVIDETLRLYPVAMGIFRQTGEPMVLEDATLPTGTQVVILPYALHRHPALWSNGDRFDPARWLPPAAPPAPFSYIPFLLGPRRCLGRQLAELELLVVVSTLVRGYQVDVLRETADLSPFLIPRFDVELPTRVRRRES